MTPHANSPIALRREIPRNRERGAQSLRWLEAASGLRDLSLLGLRLEKLKGNRAGQYSMRVNDQYRLCFTWKRDGAHSVELTDYH
jgi:proteic killer suppression protein